MSFAIAAIGIALGAGAAFFATNLGGPSDEPAPTVTGAEGKYPLEFHRALQNGDFEAEVSNPIGSTAYLQCQIDLRADDGEPATTRTYDVITTEGDRETSRLYTTRFLLGPSASQVFGATVAVAEAAIRYEGSCEAVPMPLDVLREAGISLEELQALVPASRPVECKIDPEACLDGG